MKKLLFYTFLGCCSCTTMIQVPITEPPEIVLPPGDQDIMFVSRFDTSMIDFTKENQIEVYKTSYQSFVEGLQKGFSGIEYLTLSLADTLIKGKWFTDQTPEFDDNGMIPGLLARYQTDYLLTLDAFELDKIQEMEVTENEDGSKSRRAYYHLEVATSLSLFDRNGNVADRMRMTDQAFINDRSVVSGLLAVGPNIGNYGDVATPLAYDLGNEYALMFIEREISDFRMFHSSKMFKNAAAMARSGRWEEAKAALLPLTEHSDPKIAKQAAHNLAIVAEAQGDSAAMSEWQRKAR